MFEIDHVLIGAIRALLLFAGVLGVHQIVTKQALETYNLDYLIKRGAFFSSVLLILIFILVQLNMYNIFSVLTIFFLVLVFVYLDFKEITDVLKKIVVKREEFLLDFFKFIERKATIKVLIKRGYSLLFPKNINAVVLVSLVAGMTTFVSRYAFLKNDLYTLSSLWIKNLEIVKSFNSNVWFGSGGNLLGELALVNFFSKISGISQEMAMHSFGLLENFALGAVLYWFVYRITTNRYIAPLSAVFFFAFFYKFLPININLLLEHNSLYLALCFALPAIIYTTNFKLLNRKKKSYFIMLCFIYTAIAFINFFVSLVLLPIFLLISFFFVTKNTLPYVGRSILAFLFGTSISIAIHWLGSYANNRSFVEFLKSAMIQVDSYSYFPQLVMPAEQLVELCLLITIGAILFIIPLFIRNRKAWTIALIMLLGTVGFIGLNYLKLTWIDVDLFYQSLSVFLVPVFGTIVGAIISYLNIRVPQNRTFKAVALSVLFLTLLAVSYFINGFLDHDFKEIDELKTDVLTVYDELSVNNMPYSYAVVNQNYGQSLSKNEHHFINYDDFLSKYAERDSVFQLKRDDEPFLQENPDYILPESVFVFVSRIGESGSQYDLETPKEVSKDLLILLKSLSKKGRNIRVFYEDKFLSVYEIVNKEKSSNLNDLIFHLE